ncbi:MAG: hypothetical protein EHM87_14530 [Burkholderiales bacterium]|nr:MAG: hypothetical protein EHM87_14530 [Burkholderiales bacterium]
MSRARSTAPHAGWIPAFVLSACVAVGAGAGLLGQRHQGRSAETQLLVTGEIAAGHYSGLLVARLRALENAAMLDAYMPDADAGPRDAMRAALVEGLAGRYPEFSWIGFADASGLVGTASEGRSTGSDASASAWWRAGMQGPYLGDVRDAEAAAASGDAARDRSALHRLAIAVPLRRGDAAPHGVLAAQVDADWVIQVREELLAIVRPLGGIELRVLLRDGTTVSGSRFEPDAILPERLDAGGFRLTGLVDGIPRIVSVHRVGGDVVVDRLGWRILVVRDPDIHQDSGRRALGVALATGTGVGLLAAVAVAPLMRRSRLRPPPAP